MSEIASARINSLLSEQASQVQPSEQIFVLSSSQLRDVIFEATKSLNSRVEALEARIIGQAEKISALEATQDSQAEDIMNQARLIKDLRKDREPQPMQRDRGEILRALLAANGGKMLAKNARQKMRVPKSSFSELLKTCDFVEKRPYHLDTRQDVLVLK